MAKIFESYKNDVVEKEHVTIKANGWVKAYDEVNRIDGKKEYEGLVHYPPESVKTVHGEVDYQSPHGRI